MKRHLIAGYFGKPDKFDAEPRQQEQLTTIDLLRRNDTLDHGLGHAIANLQKLGVHPSEIGVDLAVLAIHVHAADTRIARSSESQDGWTREIRLLVPVSDVKLWKSVSTRIKEILDFLTGDKWEIEFRSRPKQNAKVVPDKLADLVAPTFDVVNLFSGGLDSLIGAIDSLEDGKTPLFVSHAGEGAVSTSQEECFHGLSEQYRKKSNFDRLRVWVSFDRGIVDDSDGESTTRGRSFLFFALGIFAGTGLGRAFDLMVPENGLIALNVPLDPLRMGALSTRTTHPHYIARWNELVAALGVPAKIVNPYMLMTKGEMVKNCGNSKLLDKLAIHSVSCSSPAKERYRGQSSGHCGHCLPCLIRRAALLGSDPTNYALPDLQTKPLNTRKAEGKQIRSLQLAIARLSAKPKLAHLLVYKPGPLDRQGYPVGELAGVYRRGLEEVGRLLKDVKTKPKK